MLIDLDKLFTDEQIKSIVDILMVIPSILYIIITIYLYYNNRTIIKIQFIYDGKSQNNSKLKPKTPTKIFNQECPVCMNGNCDIIFNCGHTLHLNCLKTWVYKNKSCIDVECFFCRRHIMSSDYFKHLFPKRRQNHIPNEILVCYS